MRQRTKIWTYICVIVRFVCTPKLTYLYVVWCLQWRWTTIHGKPPYYYTPLNTTCCKFCWNSRCMVHACSMCTYRRVRLDSREKEYSWISRMKLELRFLQKRVGLVSTPSSRDHTPPISICTHVHVRTCMRMQCSWDSRYVTVHESYSVWIPGQEHEFSSIGTWRSPWPSQLIIPVSSLQRQSSGHVQISGSCPATAVSRNPSTRRPVSLSAFIEALQRCLL